MPKIICKSGYIKKQAHIMNLLDYTGNKLAEQQVNFVDGTSQTFEGDKKLNLDKLGADNVADITLYYKDGGSKTISATDYEQYVSSEKKAVTVHTLQTLEDTDTVQQGPHEMKDLDFYKYLSYVAERPGVEKVDGHGLFGVSGNIGIYEAKEQAQQYADSIHWSHILSLDTLDAKTTGFDNRQAWQDLVLSKAPTIAKLYNISLENLVINAAFHGNTDNPHIHLLFYSKDKTEGFIKGGAPAMEQASKKLKSTFLNTIFKDDVSLIQKELSLNRDSMQQAFLEALHAEYKNPDWCRQLAMLSQMLPEHGKMQYQYLPGETKEVVNQLLADIVTGDKNMAHLYEGYIENKRQQARLYADNPQTIEKVVHDVECNFFAPTADRAWRGLHNEIVRSAHHLRTARAEETSSEEKKSAYPVSENFASSHYEPDDTVPIRELEEPMPPPANKEQSSKKQRAVKGKNKADYTPEEQLASEIYEKIQKAAYITYKGLFNTKTENSLLQDELLQTYLDVRDEPEDSAEHIEAKHKIVQMMCLDAPFHDVFVSFTGAEAEIAKKELDNFIENYAQTLDDQKYFQILDAYSEDYAPAYNKKIFAAMREHFDDLDLQNMLLDIREINELFPAWTYNEDDKILKKYISGQIAKFWAKHIIKTKEHDEYISNYCKEIDAAFHANAKKADRYCKRFENTTNKVLRLMRPHYNVVLQAQSMGKTAFSRCITKAKSTTALHKAVKQSLEDAITGDGFSAQFLRQELGKQFIGDESFCPQTILKMMYSLDADFGVALEAMLEEVTESMADKGLDGKELAADYKLFLQTGTIADEQLKRTFTYLPLQGMLQRYNDNYALHIALHYLPDRVRAVTKELFGAVENGIVQDTLGEQLKEAKQVFKENDRDMSPLVHLMEKLEQESAPLKEQKEALFNEMVTVIKSTVPISAQQKEIDKLKASFATGNRTLPFYNTLAFITENLDTVYAQAIAKTLPQATEFRKRLNKRLFEVFQNPRDNQKLKTYLADLRKATEPKAKQILCHKILAACFKDNPDIKSAFYETKAAFEESYEKLYGQAVQPKMFYDYIVQGEYNTISSSISYIAENGAAIKPDIMYSVLTSMCRALAYGLYQQQERRAQEENHHQRLQEHTRFSGRGKFSHLRHTSLMEGYIER